MIIKSTSLGEGSHTAHPKQRQSTDSAKATKENLPGTTPFVRMCLHEDTELIIEQTCEVTMVEIEVLEKNKEIQSLRTRYGIIHNGKNIHGIQD